MSFSTKVGFILWALLSVGMWIWTEPLDGYTSFDHEPQSTFIGLMSYFFSLAITGALAWMIAEWLRKKYKEEANEKSDL